jgi:protein-export SecD/SecF family membrane protein
MWSVVILILAALLGWFAVSSSHYPFRLGLDLAGGTELTYSADLSQIPAGQEADSMEALKGVIERRVDLFGVSEPQVQTESAGGLNTQSRLIVDLPGVTDVQQAIAQIGKTPTLDFRLATPIKIGTTTMTEFVPTGLTGAYLTEATLEFNNTSGQPSIGLQFNSQGGTLFDTITKQNTGKVLGIFLDNQPISEPTIDAEISGGQAQITGSFTVAQAQDLVRNLNYGALPVPITLENTQTIGPSLGAQALHAGILAALWGFMAVVLFLILWYRLPGLVASIALVIYVIISLAAFKLIPVTLTAAGLAGFVLSIGMAVDANILIFERMKEELRRGRALDSAMREGFHRAWSSIRDSNISSIITAIVLFWIGVSEVKGFALTLGLGVLISMLTAITISRTFLFALSLKHENPVSRFLFGSGFRLNNAPRAGEKKS